MAEDWTDLVSKRSRSYRLKGKSCSTIHTRTLAARNQSEEQSKLDFTTTAKSNQQNYTPNLNRLNQTLAKKFNYRMTQEENTPNRRRTATKHTHLPAEHTFSTYQRHKKMVKYEINSNERCELLAGFPHGKVHDFVPAFLCKDLKHGHCGLQSKQTETVFTCTHYRLWKSTTQTLHQTQACNKINGCIE